MKTVTIISGVAGMTGSSLAARLLDRGETVIGFDNYFAGSREVVATLLPRETFTFFEYDITDSVNLDALFSFVKGTFPVNIFRLRFVNCAAVVHTRHFYCPGDTFTVNVVAMRDCLERTIRCGFSTFINCSSSEVYSMASWQEGGVREVEPVLLATAEQSLRTSYAAGKLMTEFFMRDVVERGLISGCSIRFANVYSPDEDHSEHIIPHIISSLFLEGKVHLLENARETYRTFLHNADSCAAVISLLDTPAALDGSIFNVGTNEEVAIVDLVTRISRLMGIDHVKIEFQGRRSADPPRRLLNTIKIHEVTGWTPVVTLEEGLRQCVAAHGIRTKSQ